jgi:structure-specific recognition protein 1
MNARDMAMNTEADRGPSLRRETFENIYLDLSKASGRCRFADVGVGWKPTGEKETSWTLDREQIVGGQWSRAARGYELKIYSRSTGVIQLDGFAPDVSGY